MVVTADRPFPASNNPYLDMNLSEACSTALLEVEQLVSDLRINALLDEYALMLETAGTELKVRTKWDDYSQRAREVGKQIIDRVVAALKAFKEKVFNLLDKAIISLQEKINTTKMIMLYRSYNKNAEVFKNLHGNSRADMAKFFTENSSVVFRNIRGSIYDIFKNDMFFMDNPDDLGKSRKIYTSNDVYNFYVQPNDGENSWDIHTAIQLFDSDMKRGFDKGWSMFFIKSYKDAIDKSVEQNIKDLKGRVGFDSTSLLDDYSLLMKNNINVVHGYIRVWSKYVSECANMVKKMAKEVDDQTVDFIEA